jgi:hypothetical protein
MKNGLILLKPTTVDKTGASSTATISANGSVEFGSCETLSLNGVFTTDYDNYMIVCRHGGSTTANALLSRLRLSGVNADAANYTYQRLDVSNTTVAASRSTSQTSGRISSTDTTQRYGFILNLYGPNLAQPTAYRTVTVEGLNNAGILDYAGTHSLSTGYDGITIYPGSGSFSGRVAVYGMRK